MIFSEKLLIATNRRGANTRMKDYYDIFKLLQQEALDFGVLKVSMNEIFEKRGATIPSALEFDPPSYENLQKYWEGFIRKMKITDGPANIKDIVKTINATLEKLHGKR